MHELLFSVVVVDDLRGKRAIYGVYSIYLVFDIRSALPCCLYVNLNAASIIDAFCLKHVISRMWIADDLL